MKKQLLSLCMVGVVATMLLSAFAEQHLTLSERYGNHMGTTMAVQSRDFYFHNAQGDVVRRVELAANVDNTFEVKNVYYYNYDDKGLLQSVVNYQWKPVNVKWEYIDSIAYTYDAQGRCIEEMGGRNTYRYEYDNAGNMTKYTDIVTATGMELQVITYSDFIEGAVNKPRKYESNSNAYTTNVYDGKMEYDVQNRLITDSQFSAVSGAKKVRTEYKYDDLGICIEELFQEAPEWWTVDNIVAGSEADTLSNRKRTVRTELGMGMYEKTEASYEDNGYGVYDWGYPNSYVREYYVETAKLAAPTSLSLVNVSTDENPNSVKITAVAPAGTGDYSKFVIWRNYTPIDTVAAVDGVIEYTESGVPSGVQTYFVQHIDTYFGLHYGTTDLASIDMNVDLAPVTNLRLMGGYKGTYSDAQHAEYETYFIKLAWDAPVCDYPVLGYKIYEKPFVIPAGEVAGDVLTFDANVPNLTSGEFRVDVVYALGTVVGEWVPFTWDNTTDFDVNGSDDADGELFLVLKDGSGKRVYNMYDANNNLYRAKENDSGSGIPLYQYFYNYDNGLLSEYYFTQYKDMGEWTEPKNHTYYTYNDKGQLVSEENTYSVRLKEYVYDAQGRLASVTERGKNYGSEVYDKLYSTTEYIEFDANNNPTRVEYLDGLYANSSYYTIFTYDDKGRCISEVAYSLEDAPQYKYENEYNDQNLVIDRIKSNVYDGVFVYASRETRTLSGNNVYTLTTYNYDEYDQVWIEYRIYTENYVALKGEYAPRNLVVTDASTADAPNSITLTCDVPVKEVPNAQYIIWRAGIPLDTVPAVNGKITYSETDLENVEHEYVVQSYDAVNDVFYNVSNAAAVEFSIELPTITNLHYVKTTEGYAMDAQGGRMPCYWVHFEWDAPQTDLEVLHYNIYDAGWMVANHTTVNTTDSVFVYREKDFNSPDQEKEVGVEVSVVYSYGESERVAATFTVEPTAVENVTVSQTYLAGDYLVTDAAAEVALYNVAGALVATYRNAEQIYLGELPSGVYLARVKLDGKQQVIKIAR